MLLHRCAWATGPHWSQEPWDNASSAIWSSEDLDSKYCEIFVGLLCDRMYARKSCRLQDFRTRHERFASRRLNLYCSRSVPQNNNTQEFVAQDQTEVRPIYSLISRNTAQMHGGWAPEHRHLTTPIAAPGCIQMSAFRAQPRSPINSTPAQSVIIEKAYCFHKKLHDFCCQMKSSWQSHLWASY